MRGSTCAHRLHLSSALAWETDTPEQREPSRASWWWAEVTERSRGAPEVLEAWKASMGAAAKEVLRRLQAVEVETGLSGRLLQVESSLVEVVEEEPRRAVETEESLDALARRIGVCLCLLPRRLGV